MKRLLTSVLIGASLLSLTGCGDDNQTDTSSSDSSTEKSNDSSKTTNSSKKKTLSEVITTGDADSAKMVEYRKKVAQLPPGEQLRRLRFDVLPKLETNGNKYILSIDVTIDKNGEFENSGQGSIYEYPENDHSKWTEVAKIYVNKNNKFPLSFKVLDKDKTPELYETLNNNIR